MKLSQKAVLMGISFAVAAVFAVASTTGEYSSEAEAHFWSGFNFYEQGKYAEAEKEYREAIRIEPDYAEAHNNLGVLLYEQGRYSEARAELERAAELYEEQGKSAHAERMRELLRELPE